MKKFVKKAVVISLLVFLTVPLFDSQAQYAHQITQTILEENQQLPPRTPIPFPESEINRDFLNKEIPIYDDEAGFSLASEGMGAIHLNHTPSTNRYISTFIDQKNESASSHSEIPQSTQEEGIYGHVTENGANASGIRLQLRYYNGSSWTTGNTTYTDSNGNYSFTSVSYLSDGQYYYVQYLNSSYDSGRLYRWSTAMIDEYSPGDEVQIGDFDIADVGEMSPGYDDTISLEEDFEWEKRSAIPSDVYELDLINPSGDEYWYTTVGNNSRHTMNCLPEGFSTGNTYGWLVGIYSPDGGYGYTFYYRVKFKKDHSCSGIHGIVTKNGSPASGVYLELRYTNDNGKSFSNRSDFTTQSDGSFEFVNIPTIPTNERYYVRYIGGNNESISDALWFWGTSQSSGYTQNSDMTVANFDIADVVLGLPAHNSTISLPYTFTWNQRPASPGENYVLGIEDHATYNPSWYISQGNNNSKLLSCLYYNMKTNTPYHWWININNYGTNAYGISYYYHLFEISDGKSCGNIFSFLPITIR